MRDLPWARSGRPPARQAVPARSPPPGRRTQTPALLGRAMGKVPARMPDPAFSPDAGPELHHIRMSSLFNDVGDETDMPTPYTLRMCIPYGERDGVHLIHQRTWAGHAVRFGRGKQDRLPRLAPAFVGRASLFLLVDPFGDEEPEGGMCVRVGAGDLLARLAQPDAASLSWEWAAAFVCDHGLSDVEACWLAQRLLAAGATSGCVVPDASVRSIGPVTLPDPDAADMSAFLHEVFRITAFLGVQGFPDAECESHSAGRPCSDAIVDPRGHGINRADRQELREVQDPGTPDRKPHRGEERNRAKRSARRS